MREGPCATNGSRSISRSPSDMAESTMTSLRGAMVDWCIYSTRVRLWIQLDLWYVYAGSGSLARRYDRVAMAWAQPAKTPSRMT